MAHAIQSIRSFGTLFSSLVRIYTTVHFNKNRETRSYFCFSNFTSNRSNCEDLFRSKLDFNNLFFDYFEVQVNSSRSRYNSMLQIDRGYGTKSINCPYPAEKRNELNLFSVLQGLYELISIRAFNFSFANSHCSFAYIKMEKET